MSHCDHYEKKNFFNLKKKRKKIQSCSWLCSRAAGTATYCSFVWEGLELNEGLAPFGAAEQGSRRGQVGVVSAACAALRPKCHYPGLTALHGKILQVIPSQDVMGGEGRTGKTIRRVPDQPSPCRYPPPAEVGGFSARYSA